MDDLPDDALEEVKNSHNESGTEQIDALIKPSQPADSELIIPFEQLVEQPEQKQEPVPDNRLQVLIDDPFLAEFESDIKLRINKYEE